jgi:type III restriction enzyme
LPTGAIKPRRFGHYLQPLATRVLDFIIRLDSGPDRYLVLETKGFDELADIKAQAADRWVKAVKADGRFGTWSYAMARKPGDIAVIVSRQD